MLMTDLVKLKTLSCIYYHAKAFCILNLSITLCCFGLYTSNVYASDNSIKVQQRPVIEESKDLNKAISSVMQWYMNALKLKANKLYYPEHIQNIQILDAELLTESRDNIVLKIWISYLKSGKTKIRQIKENFVFDFNKSNHFIKLNELSSKDIYSNVSLEKYDADYYQQRSFAYAWLALMDDSSDSTLPKKVFESTHYQLEIGDQRFTGSLLNTLNKRISLMGNGKHFLRSISAQAIGNNLQLTLISSWRGISPSNKPSIAKIEQIIELEKTLNGYQILSIKEQHLLPDIAPWEKMLC